MTVIILFIPQFIRSFICNLQVHSRLHFMKPNNPTKFLVSCRNVIQEVSIHFQMRPSTFLSLFFFGHMLFLDMPFSEFYQFLVGLFREAEPCQVSKNGGVNVTRYHCCYSRNHQGRQGTCISKYPHHYQILLILSFYPYKRTRVKLYIRLNF